MQLTPHFTLEEMIASDVAQRRGIFNKPSADIIECLKITAHGMELLRAYLIDAPIHINSGYRSVELNAYIGGAADSDHCLGWAVDFIAPNYGTPYQICCHIHDSFIGPYTQLIYEWTWVHISFNPKGRAASKYLTRNDHGYQTGIVNV